MELHKAYVKYDNSNFPIIDLTDLKLHWQGIGALFAPSGSGKTTLFRLLAGWFEKEASCEYHLDSDIDSYKDVRFIGSHASLLPWLTISRNIKVQAKGMEDKQIASELNAVGLDHTIIDTYPYHLSLGMYKRVELVISVQIAPKVLLLDEFFSSIDYDNKNIVKSYLEKKRADEMTWVVVHESELGDWLTNKIYKFNIDVHKTVTGVDKL